MSTQAVYDTLHSRITQRLSEIKGGSGSGNFNHEGRPGERGGSSSGGGGEHESKELTQEERDAVREQQNAAYGSKFGGYVVSNTYLREGKVLYEQSQEHLDDHIRNLDSAFDKSPADRDMTLYRGVNHTEGMNLKVGETFTDKGYVSTSTNKAVGKQFAEKLNYWQKPATFEIRVPKGYPAIEVAKVTGFKAGLGKPEREVLLSRDTTFKVLSQRGDKYVLEVIPKDTKSHSVVIDLDNFTEEELTLKGGSGSGNFGHGGRPGERGGSSSEGGGDSIDKGWSKEGGGLRYTARFEGKDAVLEKDGNKWKLTFDGETHTLPKKASFDHAEGVIKERLKRGGKEVEPHEVKVGDTVRTPKGKDKVVEFRAKTYSNYDDKGRGSGSPAISLRFKGGGGMVIPIGRGHKVTIIPSSDKEHLTSNKKSLPPEYLKSTHTFASTQINIDTCSPDGSDVSKRILALARLITDDLLAEGGREETPHITLKYGLESDSPADVRRLLANEHPINFTFGPVDVFEAEETGADEDVVMLRIYSPDLVRLNKLLTDKTENETTFTYNPHCTLAYVRAGEGSQFRNMANDITGLQLSADAIIFSDRAGNETKVVLGGVPAMARRINYEMLETNIRARLAEMRAETKGGAGSGNFGHGGRPGERGGSSSEGGVGPGGKYADDVREQGKKLIDKEDALHERLYKAVRNYDDSKARTIEKKISEHREKMRAFEDKHGVTLDTNNGVVFQEHLWKDAQEQNHERAAELHNKGG